MSRLLHTLFVCCLLTFALAIETLSVKKVLETPKEFHNKEVVVSGKVDKYEQRTSRIGNEYFRFKLVDKDDKKAIVNIYGQGKLKKAPEKGDLVEVKGKYFIESKVGSYTYKNEVQIKPEGLKILKPAE